MNIVIISQNQCEYIIPMYNSLNKEGNHIIFVFDRCTDDSIEVASNSNIPFITNTKGNGRKTSTCRNLGYNFLKERYGLDDTIFLDCDRYITEGNINELKTSKCDIELLQLQNDFRTPSLIEDNWGSVHNNFFSCGVYIKKDCLSKIENFYKKNKVYKNSSIFPENIEEHWGIEDTHLGDICFHLGFNCSLNQNIKLNGRFERLDINNLDVLMLRFKLRDALNVKW